MENEILSSERPVLTLTSDAENFLVTAARWSKFLGILGFISSGLVVISAMFVGMVMTMLSAFAGAAAMPFPPIVVSLVYVVIGAVYFFVALFLYKFGSNAGTALKTRRESYLEDSLKSLKLHFTIMGVLAIIGLSLMVLMFLAVAVTIIVGIPGSGLMN
ncbi:MAG: DUF5362 family protein [Breznakibacter sp.]